MLKQRRLIIDVLTVIIFLGSVFFLPFDYSSRLNRYKLFGNFCSPNCVKSYSINNKTFQNKTYLIDSSIENFFGPNFRIQPAPSILNLKKNTGENEYRRI